MIFLVRVDLSTSSTALSQLLFMSVHLLSFVLCFFSLVSVLNPSFGMFSSSLLIFQTHNPVSIIYILHTKHILNTITKVSFTIIVNIYLLKLQFTHDYVLYMDKLYILLHVMRLK